MCCKWISLFFPLNEKLCCNTQELLTAVTPLSLRMEELHFSPTTQYTNLLSHMSALMVISYKKIFQHKYVFPAESGQLKLSHAVSFIELFSV